MQTPDTRPERDLDWLISITFDENVLIEALTASLDLLDQQEKPQGRTA